MRVDNIIAQAQTQSCTSSAGFGGKEWLEYFIYDVLWNTVAIVGDFNDDLVVYLFCFH